MVTRWLAVSHSRSSRGGDVLIYAPERAEDGEGACAPVFREVDQAEMEAAIAAVRHRAEELTALALTGRPRGGLGIEEPAAALAELALPREGILPLVGAGVEPQLQLLQDIAARVPWEAIEETHFSCPHCGEAALACFGPSARQFCSRCGQPMRAWGGKLAVATLLSHVVAGQRPPAARGEAFLIFDDPLRDLCAPEHDPQGVCRDHVAEIEALLGRMGYETSRFRGTNVTCDRLLDALTDPTVIGIYYFGHGRIVGGEGLLQLADGTLSAVRLQELGALTPFVFLNACETASTVVARYEQPRSVAGAVAAPSHWKTVIAPVWPVVNVQAAQTALHFFQAARRFGPLGRAMREARLASLERYVEGHPDLAWAAYRFFGSPQRPLPLPEVGSAAKEVPARVFDAGLGLQADAFSFAIADVLGRAARRCQAQGRQRTGLVDLAAGLCRRGSLLRQALIELLCDPDALADTLEAPSSQRAPGISEQRRSGWSRADLEPELARLLIAAGRVARERRGAAAAIAERDVLSCLLESKMWQEILPAGLGATELARRIAWLLERGEVDDDGCLALGALAPRARRVIAKSHAMAQQRGTIPISHRLVLAAFLDEPQGALVRACGERGLDPEHLLHSVLASQDPAAAIAAPHTLALSPELGHKIVAPMLEHARRAVPPWQPIDDKELWRAFWAVAEPSFKQWARQMIPEIDVLLPAPATGDAEAGEPQEVDLPDWSRRLDPSALQVIARAHRLSENEGKRTITHRALLAAFLSGPESHAVRLLLQSEPALAWQHRLDRLLAGSSGAPVRFPLDERACRFAVAPVVSEALVGGGKRISEADLLRAFCRVCPPEVVRALKRPFWDLDLAVLAETGPGDRSAESERSIIGTAAAFSPGAQASELRPAQRRAEAIETAGGHVLRLPLGFSRFDFDDHVWRCIGASVTAALERGWARVRSPHLFAAMLMHGVSVPERGALGPEETRALRQLALSVLPPRPPADVPRVTLSHNIAAVLDRARERALADGREQINMQDLALAFFEDGGGGIGDLLRILPRRSPASGSPN